MDGESGVSPARILLPLVLLLALLAIGGPSAHADPPAPPPEQAALYAELSQGLNAFEAQIDADWGGSVGSGRFAPGLSAANGNKSAGLLLPSNWTRMIEMLDAFEAKGVELVKIDLHYPVFTPAFHTYLAAHPPPLIPVYNLTVDSFIGYPNSFYNRLAAEIDSRGMELWIEHSTLFDNYTTTPPGPYFADMRTAGVAATRSRYLQERAAEMALIVSELQPEYYSLVDEPTTQNDNFGYFSGGVPILTQDGWRDLVQDGAAAIAATDPGSTSLLGAGSGTWETIAYTQRFAALPELDFIDFHQYPLATTGQDYLQNLLNWTDYVRAVAPAKKVTLGEAWLYKASVADVAGSLDYDVIFGRDSFSFWEPLDTQFLDVMFKIMHLKDFEAMMPFWTQYYFYYNTYGDPALEGMTGSQLITAAAQAAIPNIQTIALTGTGQRFFDLLVAASDADGDGTPDSQDNSDSDGDLLTDRTEFYCGSAANNAARRPERTDGAFGGADEDGDLAIDETLPTSAPAYDCDGDGYTGAEEDHVFLAVNRRDQGPCGAAAWPADFVSGGIPDSTNYITITDLTSFIAPVRHFNTSPNETGFDLRWDIDPGRGLFNEDINITDLTSLIVVAPPMLGGTRAFNGPVCPWP